MRILVLSDTHMHDTGNTFPAIVEREARSCDCCLHAGDFISRRAYTLLSGWTTVYGVCGNMDEQYIQDTLPDKRILELDGVRIGLIHGRGAPDTVISYVANEFSHETVPVKLVVYGHSHVAADKELQGVAYFNPGSATDKVFAPFCSYGIIDISNGTIKRRIVKIE